jgi:excisionase family DNA binding protein
VEIDVQQAADRLGVHPSRVRALLRRGELSGRRLGSRWLVTEEDVARLVGHGARGTRPPSPARAWGLLHLLQGRDPGWLSPVARSQLRARVRELVGADAARWRTLLRGRSDVLRLYGHPAAIRRLLADPHVVAAGAQVAAAAGIDLVVTDAVAEAYVREDHAKRLIDALALLDRPGQVNLLLRVPRQVWPFDDGRNAGGAAVLAADLLEAAEPRSISSAVAVRNALAAAAAVGSAR